MKINFKLTTIVLGAMTALFLLIGLITLGVCKVKVNDGTYINGYQVDDITAVFKKDYIKGIKDAADNNDTDKSNLSAARGIQAGAVFAIILTPIFGAATMGSAAAWYINKDKK